LGGLLAGGLFVGGLLLDGGLVTGLAPNAGLVIGGFPPGPLSLSPGAAVAMAGSPKHKAVAIASILFIQFSLGGL